MRRGRWAGCAAVVAALLAGGCGNDPEATYLRLCLAASTVELQRASCRCMSAEYGAILDEDEYEAVAIMMEKAAGSAAPAAAGAEPMTTFVEPSAEISDVLMRALAKMDRLHRAGVCGYGQHAPPAGP